MCVCVRVQTILFSISSLFYSIQPIDRTISGATTPCQCGPRSDGDERVFAFPKAPALLE